MRRMRGQRFILRDPTIAVGLDESGKQIAMTIPAGTEITVSDVVPVRAATDPGEQVHIEWNGRSLAMFLADLQTRGERV
jgi:hypothetical protein